jgi:LuxR family transcriptional regulator, maltose regulon positive regulatory protein
MVAADEEEYRRLPGTIEMYRAGQFEHSTLARVLLARHEGERAERSAHQATRLPERLLLAAEEGGRTGRVIEVLVLRALAHQALGDIPAALSSLERAVTLAAPEGYVRVFIDERRLWRCC